MVLVRRRAPLAARRSPTGSAPDLLPRAAAGLAALVAASALLAAPGAVQAQNVVLTASTWVPAQHLLSITQSAWCDQVAQATAGRVRCNVLPKPVAAPPATFDAIRDGLADLSFTVHGYTPGRFLATQLAELPFLGDSAEATSIAYQRIHERHLAKAGEHKGVKVLAVFTHGPGGIYNTKKPIAQLGDLQGLKFRVGGGIVNDIGRAIGANVTLKPSTESYELVSSGVMDGVFFPPESVEAFKLDKLVRFRTAFPGGLYNTSFVFMMNEGTWNRIGKADQAAIEKLSGEHAARMFGRAWDVADRRSYAVMQASGVQPATASKGFVDEVRARTEPVERKVFADAKSRGVAEPERVMREFRAEIGKL